MAPRESGHNGVRRDRLDRPNIRMSDMSAQVIEMRHEIELEMADHELTDAFTLPIINSQISAITWIAIQNPRVSRVAPTLAGQ
jgi:hypothetical protein